MLTFKHRYIPIFDNMFYKPNKSWKSPDVCSLHFEIPKINIHDIPLRPSMYITAIMFQPCKHTPLVLSKLRLIYIREHKQNVWLHLTLFTSVIVRILSLRKTKKAGVVQIPIRCTEFIRFGLIYPHSSVIILKGFNFKSFFIMIVCGIDISWNKLSCITL